MRARSRQTPSLLHCAFRRFHVIEGKNPRDQITSDRRCKHSWSDCILMHSIHSLVKGQKNVGYIRGQTCCACLITTWRLGLRATKFCRPHPVTRGRPQLSGLIQTRSLFQQNHCLRFAEDRKRAQRAFKYPKF